MHPTKQRIYMAVRKSSLFPILMINFIGSLGFSIVLPFLVFLVTKFEGNALVYGVLGAVYPAFQLIGAPILGKMSDSYGRKKILLLSEVGTLIGWIIFITAFFVPLEVILKSDSNFLGPFIITLPILIIFAARAIDGLTGGNISIANAYVADITSEKDRNKNFGKLSVSSNLGFIAGPAIAGLLGSTEYKELLPVIAASVISLTACLITYFFLPESKVQLYKESSDNSALRKVIGYESKECFDFNGKNRSVQKITLKEILKLNHISYFLFLNFLIFLG
ncbi:MAG: MFS transporter, partial [Ignavibacteria bacterium]